MILPENPDPIFRAFVTDPSAKLAGRPVSIPAARTARLDHAFQNGVKPAHARHHAGHVPQHPRGLEAGPFTTSDAGSGTDGQRQTPDAAATAASSGATANTTPPRTTTTETSATSAPPTAASDVAGASATRGQPDTHGATAVDDAAPTVVDNIAAHAAGRKRPRPADTTATARPATQHQ